MWSVFSLVVVLVGGQLDGQLAVEREVDRVMLFSSQAFLPNSVNWGIVPNRATNLPTQMWPSLAPLERNLYFHEEQCFDGAQMSLLCVFKAKLFLAMTRIQMLVLSVGPFSSLEH